MSFAHPLGAIELSYHDTKKNTSSLIQLGISHTAMVVRFKFSPRTPWTRWHGHHYPLPNGMALAFNGVGNESRLVGLKFRHQSAIIRNTCCERYVNHAYHTNGRYLLYIRWVTGPEMRRWVKKLRDHVDGWVFV
jgi:hypothetical protein